MQILKWEDIYEALYTNPDDVVAWHSLQWRVRGMASALSDLGWHTVDDVVEDTCTKVVLDVKRARGASTFAGFVFGHFRTMKRSVLARPQVDNLEGVDVAGTQYGGLDPDDLMLLRACLERLAERSQSQHDAVALRYLWGTPPTEIAHKMKVTVNNARQLVFRGLAGLRSCVGVGAHGA